MGRLLVCLALLSASFAGAFVQRAQASAFEVAPISLTLSSKVSSGMLVVTNHSPEPLRFHITAFSWDQKPDGEMILSPTKDLVFFPAMLTLNPQEARNLRIGANVKPGAVEKSYRVFVQELPALASADQQPASTVGVLTKMGVPVFLEAQTPKTTPSVASLSLQGSKLTFQIKNNGNVHFRPEAVIVRAKDGQTVLHTQEVDGWYVLAGKSTTYVVSLPTTVCTTLKSIDVELKSDRGPATATLGNAHCTP
jgi:fimbrial chaperone protein